MPARALAKAACLAGSMSGWPAVPASAAEPVDPGLVTANTELIAQGLDDQKVFLNREATLDEFDTLIVPDRETERARVQAILK